MDIFLITATPLLELVCVCGGGGGAQFNQRDYFSWLYKLYG